MFLNELTSLEIGLLAGGGAILLAVLVVLILILCKQCGRTADKENPKSPNYKRRRRMTTANQHSTIDLPPLLFIDSIGGSRCNVMGMIDNPLKAFPCEGDTKASCCTHVSDTLRSEYKSVESLVVPRSPREFMYYMRNLEQTRSQSGLNNTKEAQPIKVEQEVHEVKLFSPGFAVSEARARADSEGRANFPPKRKTSGALRNAAYREMMQGNTSFHVVCTSPCTDETWSDDSDSEPEIHDPKARIRFTTILEEQGGSTGSRLNVVSTTALPPTYHESRHLRSLLNGQCPLNERV